MDEVPEHCLKPVLILGCGNVLFGDDGFGPAVVKYLQNNYKIPEDICLVDAGTGAREILFDVVLSSKRPHKIIVVDAMDMGKKSGEIALISVDDIPSQKMDDFSLHQIPTSNLLKELKDFCNVDVVIVACQPQNIPQEVRVGLSITVESAIPKACDIILSLIR